MTIARIFKPILLAVSAASSASVKESVSNLSTLFGRAFHTRQVGKATQLLNRVIKEDGGMASPTCKQLVTQSQRLKEASGTISSAAKHRGPVPAVTQNALGVAHHRVKGQIASFFGAYTSFNKGNGSEVRVTHLPPLAVASFPTLVALAQEEGVHLDLSPVKGSVANVLLAFAKDGLSEPEANAFLDRFKLEGIEPDKALLWFAELQAKGVGPKAAMRWLRNLGGGGVSIRPAMGWLKDLRDGGLSPRSAMGKSTKILSQWLATFSRDANQLKVAKTWVQALVTRGGFPKKGGTLEPVKVQDALTHVSRTLTQWGEELSQRGIPINLATSWLADLRMGGLSPDAAMGLISRRCQEAGEIPRDLGELVDLLVSADRSLKRGVAVDWLVGVSPSDMDFLERLENNRVPVGKAVHTLVHLRRAGIALDRLEDLRRAGVPARTLAKMPPKELEEWFCQIDSGTISLSEAERWISLGVDPAGREAFLKIGDNLTLDVIEAYVGFLKSERGLEDVQMQVLNPYRDKGAERSPMEDLFLGAGLDIGQLSEENAKEFAARALAEARERASMVVGLAERQVGAAVGV